jgi:indole-3-glycerol phosphate synthase
MNYLGKRLNPLSMFVIGVASINSGLTDLLCSFSDKTTLTVELKRFGPCTDALNLRKDAQKIAKDYSKVSKQLITGG